MRVGSPPSFASTTWRMEQTRISNTWFHLINEVHCVFLPHSPDRAAWPSTGCRKRRRWLLPCAFPASRGAPDRIWKPPQNDIFGRYWNFLLVRFAPFTQKSRLSIEYFSLFIGEKKRVPAWDAHCFILPSDDNNPKSLSPAPCRFLRPRKAPPAQRSQCWRRI